MLKSPNPSLHSSRKSIRSQRSTHSLKSNKSNKSLRSNKSTRSIRIFNHAHHSYATCFGVMHVKIATCAIGFLALLGVCFSLVYCVFTSQEQRRPNMKMYAIPMTIVVLALLYLFVGILQQKAKLLYPFITLQICIAFAIAVTIIMLSISIGCNTHLILELFVDVTQPNYMQSALFAVGGLISQLIVQLWALRAVCGCLRYFADLANFEARENEINYV